MHSISESTGVRCSSGWYGLISVDRTVVWTVRFVDCEASSTQRCGRFDAKVAVLAALSEVVRVAVRCVAAAMENVDTVGGVVRLFTAWAALAGSLVVPPVSVGHSVRTSGECIRRTV
jgi:hypothetical protein